MEYRPTRPGTLYEKKKSVVIMDPRDPDPALPPRTHRVLSNPALSAGRQQPNHVSGPESARRRASNGLHNVGRHRRSGSDVGHAQFQPQFTRPLIYPANVAHTHRDDVEPPPPQFVGPMPVAMTPRVTCPQSTFSTNSDWASTKSMCSASSSDLDPSDSASSTDSSTDHVTKKLDESEASIIKSAHISNEHLRLTELLDAMTPDQLMDEIRTKLDKKDSKFVVALSVLLPRKHFPPVDHLHCVRCHKKFRPFENSNCVVKHPTAKVMKIGRDKHGGEFKCNACGVSFYLNQMFFYNEDVNSYLSGFCYSGKHTTNPKEVSYTTAVRTCEETGCVEFYV